MRRSHALMLVATMAGVLLGAPILRAQDVAVDPNFAEGRRLFEDLDYEAAVKALDRAITALQDGRRDPARQDLLASAYEMRARSRFGTGDPDGAVADFVALLKIRPAYALTGQVSPRVVTLFEQTVAAQVTTLVLAVTPASATVRLDGQPVQPGSLRLAVGEHTLTAEQHGYRTLEQTVAAVAGAPVDLAVTLERISSVLTVATTPADVDVTLDGVAVGRTAAGTPLVLADVAVGSRLLRFSRACHVPQSLTVEVSKPDDYTVPPVTLMPATARLVVTASAPDAQVFVNGEARGIAPLTIPDLCEGDYAIDVRAPTGSDSARVTVKAGGTETVTTSLRPALALVSVSGPGSSVGADPRVVVERALTRLSSLRVFAPPADAARAALEAHRLPADWLALDATGRPTGASAQVAQAARAEVSAALGTTFNAQAVASVTLLDANRVVLAILAGGSSVPDVIEIRLDRQESLGAAIDKLDRSSTFLEATLGLTTIDVTDITGAVVVDVAGLTGAGIQAGDVVVTAAGKPVTSTGVLRAAVADTKPGETLALELRTGDGSTKPVAVPVTTTPRLISLYDREILANRLLLDLRARLASPGLDALTQATLRLNAAVALARAGDWSRAHEELLRVQLPPGPGVSQGTVEYFTGVAAERLGNRPAAEAAFRKAAASGGLITEHGPAVSDLAAARLSALQEPAR